jgi:hypothetical protein
MAASSFGLPEPWRTVAIAGQCWFYVLALADPVIREGHFLKRLSAVIRAFTVLVAAALFAVSIFFLPAKTLWKETTVKAARETGSTS